MTKIKFSTSQFLAALALAAAIGLMIQAININPASALEGEETSGTTQESTVSDHVSSQAEFETALADPTITTITVDADFGATSNILINRDVTIDLGGHTITNVASNARLFKVTKGNVTIKNGTLKTTGASGITIMVTGSGDASEADYTVLNVANDVTLKTAENDDLAYGIFISHVNNHAYGVKVNFEGTIIGGEGFQIYGTIQDTTGYIPEITIGSKAKITVSDMGIYAAGYAKWNIGAATIVAGNPLTRSTIITGTGIGAKAGVFALNGTKITANGAKVDTSVANGGMQGNGAVFQIENNASYAGAVEVTVNGGTYTSQNNAVFYQDGDASQTLKSLTINSGTFKAGKDVDVFSLSPQSDSLVKISSGTFNSDVSRYLDGDWEMTKDADGNWVVGVAPSEPGVTDPTNPSKPGEDKDDASVTIPNTGAVSHGAAVNAIASVSLIVSIFVAGGIFYNRYKVYHRVKAYVPNPSVDRIRKK